MGDVAQVVVVTVVAAAALLALLRPLFSRGGKGQSRPAGGCESCGAAEKHGSGGRS